MSKGIMKNDFSRGFVSYKRTSFKVGGEKEIFKKNITIPKIIQLSPPQ